MGLDDIAKLSRAAAAELDRHEHLIGGSYTLEVTSPGVDRPLTTPRHWRRARLRLVTVRPREGKPFTGRVGAAGEDAVTMLVDGALRRSATPTSSALPSRWSSSPHPRPKSRCLLRPCRGSRVNVDIAALRAIERDKEIPFDTVLEAIETALSPPTATPKATSRTRASTSTARPVWCA